MSLEVNIGYDATCTEFEFRINDRMNCPPVTRNEMVKFVVNVSRPYGLHYMCSVLYKAQQILLFHCHFCFRNRKFAFTVSAKLFL
jgi:hypothetical protein